METTQAGFHKLTTTASEVLRALPGVRHDSIPHRSLWRLQSGEKGNAWVVDVRVDNVKELGIDSANQLIARASFAAKKGKWEFSLEITEDNYHQNILEILRRKGFKVTAQRYLKTAGHYYVVNVMMNWEP